MGDIGRQDILPHETIVIAEGIEIVLGYFVQAKRHFRSLLQAVGSPTLLFPSNWACNIIIDFHLGIEFSLKVLYTVR